MTLNACNKDKNIRIGILGGTFDPPHNAHVELARVAFEQCNLDELLVMPAGVPVYKLDKPVTPAIHRLKMCELAFANLSVRHHIKVSDAEIKRGRKTYTAHTLKEIHAQNERAQLFFIAGMDAALTMPKWRDSQTIAELASVVVADRCEASNSSQHCDVGANTQVAKTKEQQVAIDKLMNTFSVIWLNASIPNISSTEIRENICAGHDVLGALPRQVEKYIRDHGLYLQL